MAITYPLTLPDTPATREIEILPVALVGESEGEFDGAQQIQDWVAGWLEMVLEYPAPLDLDEAEPLVALALALNGKAGTLAAGDPTRKLARGKAANYQTNLLQWSEESQRSVWARFENTVTGVDTITDPNGGTTAERLTPSGGATNSYQYQTVSPAGGSGGKTYTFSVYLKAASGTPTIRIIIQSVLGTNRNFLDCVLSTSWQRFSVTATMQSGDTTVLVVVGGNGSWPVADGDIDVWGWQLEEASAATTYKPTGGAVVYSDIARDFLLFDGSNDYVTIPHDARYNSSNASWEFWWRAPTAAPADLKHLFQKGTTQSDREFLFYQQNGTGKLVLSFGTGTIFEDSPSAVGYTDGKLHHVIGTKSGTSVKMYVDGVEVMTGTLSATPVTGTASILIANSVAGASSNAVAGAMCEFRIWQTARTLTQIRDNLAKQLVGNETGLAGYWKLDAGSGSSAADSQTNYAANNGTISGAVWSGLNRYEMLTANWPASQTGVLKRGDWLQLGTVAAATAALKKTMGAADVDANAGGVALVDIFPLLRGTLPADQAAIVHYDAKGLWRQQENATPYRIDVVKHYGITLRLKEAF